MKELYNHYKKVRGVEVSFEEFQILILAYPIFKVANADGSFDHDESLLLKEILMNFLTEIYGENLTDSDKNNLAELYIEDLMFVNSSEQFNQEFLNSLSAFQKEIKNSVSSLLIEIAEVSGGLDEQENEMIEYLTKSYLS